MTPVRTMKGISDITVDFQKYVNSISSSQLHIDKDVDLKGTYSFKRNCVVLLHAVDV